MGNTQNWRTEINASDYFGHQQKQSAIEQRRPTVRKASDLVGPGIGASAVRLDDYNDLLATFNGYYASVPGALNAPDAFKDLALREAFVGQVISDSELGGRQVFTGLTSGATMTRTFTRSPVDPESIGWGVWGGQRIPATAQGYVANILYVDPGYEMLITPPNLVLLGDTGVYERSEAGIRVRRQGIYTGTIQVGSTDLDAIASVTMDRPDGRITRLLTQRVQDVGHTCYYPFTVWAADGEQGFAISLSHSMAATTGFWWRFSCTRVGDAV